MKADRSAMVESPWRNRPSEESLKVFREMKQGRWDEGKATLRLKINMKDPNPTLRDPVA